MAPKSPKNAFQERPEGPQERPKWPPRGLPEHFLHPLPHGDSMPRNRGALLGKVYSWMKFTPPVKTHTSNAEDGICNAGG